MNKILYAIQILIALLGISQFTNAQSAKAPYDSQLAKKLGADDYGMKSYVMVLLKTGSEKKST